MSTLDDVLSEEKQEKQEPEKEVKESPGSAKQAFREKEAKAVEAGRKRDEQGRFEKEEKEKKEAEVGKEAEKPEKPEAKVETKSEEVSARERAAHAAMMDERRKRQELEQRLAQYDQQIKQAQNPPKPFVEDPDGALARYQQQMQEQLAGAVVQTKVSATEAVARAQYKDYDEIVNVFGQVCQNIPGLYHQALAAPNPAEFAYRIGKNYADLQAAGSIDQLKQRVEKETRAKLELEFKQKQEELERQRRELPPSLSEARSVNQQRVQWNGPTSLDAILK